MGFQERFRSSLTYPIAATLVLVTVVPVALVGFLLASHNREHLTTLEKQYLTRQAVSLASEVYLYFAGHRTQLESTVRALQAGDELRLPASESLLQGMAAEPGRSFVYLQILYRSGDGAYVQSPQLSPAALEALPPFVQDAHRRALEGEEVADLNIVLGPGTAPNSATVTIFSSPLLSRQGVIWGTLTGVLDLGPLQNRIMDNAYGGLLVSIIDQHGKVVVSSEPSLRRSDLSQSPLVADFLENALRLTQTYVHPIDPEAGEVLGSVAPVERLNWGVVVERPTAEAFATVRVMQVRTGLITAVAAIVALGIGFGLSRQLIRPIQTLADVSSQIAEGDLAVRATVSGHDEIARLATNFNHMAGSVEALVRRLRQALRQNQELFLETIRTLAAAIDAKDPYTRGHSERVSSYSMAVARHLGLNQDEVFRVRIAAILHDVGKLGVRDGILNKPGGLTEEEFAVMRRHAEIGAQIMSPIRMLKDIIPGIRNHHETWEGTGYPDRLKAEEIPLVARIIGVADTFDAMTTNRPYQQAMTLDYVVNKMRSMSGTRFDPKVVDAFVAAVTAGDVTPPSLAPSGAEAQQEVS